MTTQVSGWSKPQMSGSHSAWASPITIPTTASTDPTERSMLRVTMTSTIPVAMIPTAAVWTERFHRLRAVRNVPPERMWNPTQMIAQRHQHPEQAGVDLGGTEQRACGANLARLVDLFDRAGQRFSHRLPSGCPR